MNKTLTAISFFLMATTGSAVHAEEKTVTLTIGNMFCAACPFMVKKTLAAVPGVSNAAVSFEDKTAVVTFDDDKADVFDLIDASTNLGYPAELQSSS